MTDRAAILVELLTDPMRARLVSRVDAVELLLELARVQRALELLAVNDAPPTNSTRAGKRARSEVVAQALPSADRLLSAKEASKRTGMSTRWLYLHADELPFACRTSGRAVRFSERGIERWKSLKQSGS